MIVSLSEAASAMTANARAQEIIARNLANVSTTGFKKGVVLFDDFSSVLAGASQHVAPTVVTDSRETIDFSEGSHTYTGGSLDVALQGEGFFVLQNPSQPDQPLYSRKGQFTLNAQGQIVNTIGLPVMGQGGPITLPPDARHIHIGAEGTVSADGNAVGTLMLVRFPQPYPLERTNFTAFKEPDGVHNAEPATDCKVRQGYLEESNVDVLGELVTMIAVMRNFEASQRMVTITDETLKQLISSV